jgi:hypothetical protein
MAWCILSVYGVAQSFVYGVVHPALRGAARQDPAPGSPLRATLLAGLLPACSMLRDV